MNDRVSVTVEVEGGVAAFPGLARPFTVDADDLSPAEAAELIDLVDESGFFSLGPEQGLGKPVPDARTYTVTVRAGDRSRTLTLSDPLPNKALRELVNLVERRRRAR
jgi:hypothetical protein